ncbi:hypothetical protein R5R35_001144 [Gryllus longicercus]|uniref:Accessory gland protein n=1 Tax=Gryllus longicercus TaxID=2509291 RepID=A0AAN9VUT9_9ORTH
MLIQVVLSLILFTLVNVEQFYAQRQPVKNKKKTFLGRKQKPPKVRSAHTKIGFGEVWTYVGPPQESQPNLLGYRISLLDLEKFSVRRYTHM